MDATAMTLTAQTGAAACPQPPTERRTPEAKVAFLQLAEEFQGLAQEIEGLISTAVISRRASSGAENRAV